MKNKIHLQGDIGLYPCEAPEVAEMIKHNGEYVLALGEHTGHGHIVRVKEPSQMVVVKDKDGNIYLQFLGEATLSHELVGTGQKADHGVHIFPATPTWYRLGHEKIFDYFEMSTRRVQD